jgi:acetylornithine deacetylase/succinyl-diaminopimelate desuccinylase-like protein
VLLPEYLADRLPVAGRGMAIFSIRLSREGEPVHEVLRPEGQPDVLAAGAELALRLRDLGARLTRSADPYAGADSVFVGHLARGEIYNQAPTACLLEGTRRWVTPGAAAAVRAEFDEILEQSARGSGVRVDASFDVQGEAFRIDARDPLVEAFQQAHCGVTGTRLPLGGKPFVDDGNGFAALAGIPALTHGPAAVGAHTLEERVPVAELVRVAAVYALTALRYCIPSESREQP